MDEALAGLAGLLLATFFFGTLWLTVRRAVSSKRPAPWFLASMLVRTSITLMGFYFVSRGHWSNLPPCLLGFFVGNMTVPLWTRVLKTMPISRASEATHAS
jgi:F1F0 ATPase subunit 2